MRPEALFSWNTGPAHTLTHTAAKRLTPMWVSAGDKIVLHREFTPCGVVGPDVSASRPLYSTVSENTALRAGEAPPETR